MPDDQQQDVRRGDSQDGCDTRRVGAPFGKSRYVPVVPRRADDCGDEYGYGQPTPTVLTGDPPSDEEQECTQGAVDLREPQKYGSQEIAMCHHPRSSPAATEPSTTSGPRIERRLSAKSNNSQREGVTLRSGSTKPLHCRKHTIDENRASWNRVTSWLRHLSCGWELTVQERSRYHKSGPPGGSHNISRSLSRFDNRPRRALPLSAVPLIIVR
jgi:hypothetical protein